jgi:hypothetical protein
MRTMTKHRWLAVAACAASATLLGASRTHERSLPLTQSSLWVEGTSTVRSYKCVARALESEIIPSSPEAATLPLAQLVRSARVAVQVEQLDCDNDTMNGHLRKALRVSEHPTIEFNLVSYEVAGGEAVLHGTLHMAGTENAIDFPATITEEDGGIVRVRAVKQIRMKDWGVKPPSLMLGTMKVHDPVDIHFDVTLQR